MGVYLEMKLSNYLDIAQSALEYLNDKYPLKFDDYSVLVDIIFQTITDAYLDGGDD
jgi:hypothetical protein